MVAQFGMSPKAGPMEYSRRYEVLSSDTKAKVEGEVRRLLTEGYDTARNLLIARRKELDLLAKALIEYETLDSSEVEKVIRGEKLKDRKPIPRGQGPITVPKPLADPEPMPPVLQPPIGGTGTPTPPHPPATA
jgi:ATP-dependent metalloprotease